MKKKIFAIVQLLIGIALIAFLYSNMKDKGDLRDALAAAARNWQLLGTGIAFFGICILLVTWRWKILLEGQGLHISTGRAIVLYFIGHFFNSFMFGSTGGDVIKAVYSAREMPHKKTEAVSTILIDRIIGLLVLIMLSITVMLTRLPFFMAQQDTRIALFINLGLLFGAIFGLFIAFRQNVFEQWPLFKKLQEKTATGEIIAKVYNACHVCICQPKMLIKAAVLSLANQLILVASCVLLALALEIRLGLIDSITMYPIMNAFAAIPLTPGGLGTRELAYVRLLGVVGVPESRAILLAGLIYGTILFWSLIGGLVYLGDTILKGKAAKS